MRHAPGVESSRKLGLCLAVPAAGMWAFVVFAFVTVAPGDGVPIGAAGVAFLAVPLSVASSIVLLVSHRRAGATGAPDRSPAGDRAAALATASVLLLPLPLLLGPADAVLPELLFGILAAGIGAFVLSTVLFLFASTGPGRSPDRADVRH